MSEGKVVPDNRGKSPERRVQDPRVAIFKTFYLDPTSHTFMNILQSGIRAGYTQQYSENISNRNPGWWRELLESSEARRAKMLQRAEQHFESVLDEKPVEKHAIDRKQRTAEFVSERVGKDVYSTRKELTDKGGKRLFNSNHVQSTQDSLAHLFTNTSDINVNV